MAYSQWLAIAKGVIADLIRNLPHWVKRAIGYRP